MEGVYARGNLSFFHPKSPSSRVGVLQFPFPIQILCNSLVIEWLEDERCIEEVILYRGVV